MEHKSNSFSHQYFFEHHLEAILLADHDGIVFYANRSAETFFACSNEQLVGVSILQVMSADERSALHYYYQKALLGESNQIEVSVATPDQSGVRTALVKIIPHGVKEDIQSVSFCLTDITQQKMAEMAQQETARELCESFIEHNRDPILLLDMDATIVLANRAFSELLGWKKENLEGFHILQCPSIPPHLIKQMQDYFQKVIAVYTNPENAEDRDKLHLLETIRMTDSGGEYQMMLSITPIYKNGDICNWAVHLRNVSDRVYLQKELEQIALKKEATDELNKWEHLHTVSQLAASISHEVRNPLTVTRGFMQLLRSSPGLSEDKKKDYINLCLSELDRAESIISDYLSFAKPNLDEVDVLELHTELEYVEKVMLPFATIKNVEYTFIPDFSTRMYFCGNAKKFHQAIINFVKNGIEASENGGKIRIETKLENNDTATIKILDNGSGMDSESLKRLGKPFYTTKDTGTGLGTMVAFSIIASMRGKVEIESKVGEGTCIWIHLPVKSEPVSG